MKLRLATSWKGLAALETPLTRRTRLPLPAPAGTVKLSLSPRPTVVADTTLPEGKTTSD
ncbi:hypothetical protein D3C72_2382380 [compost metagenome]